ncbi:MAG: hypothetical protein CVU55_02270 [Deltaproteobacteria bacterium HGW-Deltaproteobacteria-13]|jgi:hypothetical protein|nr:MAG: hypothetical protein CVU55_02270 [Deltaproteobacteria bacterium HGW-Deltaproteobacteria-13]
MATIMPESEQVQKAIKWISISLEDDNQPIKTLLEKAILKFDLSPKDSDFLMNFFANRDK